MENFGDYQENQISFFTFKKGVEMSCQYFGKRCDGTPEEGIFFDCGGCLEEDGQGELFTADDFQDEPDDSLTPGQERWIREQEFGGMA